MLRNSARVVPVDGHLSPVQDLVLVAEDIEDEDLNAAEFQARPAGGSTAKMVPPATTFSQGSSGTNTASVKRGEEEAASGVLDDKKSFRRAGLAVRTLQRQSTEALKRVHAKKAPPVRYVDYKYQSSGTLITTSSSRRRSSIPPPKAPSDPWICRSLAKLVPKRRTFRLPVPIVSSVLVTGEHRRACFQVGAMRVLTVSAAAPLAVRIAMRPTLGSVRVACYGIRLAMKCCATPLAHHRAVLSREQASGVTIAQLHQARTQKKRTLYRPT